jgi:hypothetical protein
MYLINEASITQGTPSDMSALECYHIELDTHEVIYAELWSKVLMVPTARFSQISSNMSDFMGASINPR